MKIGHMSASDYSISITESDINNHFDVNLSGNLTIENSDSIHNYLIKRALSQDSITLNISESDEIDLSIFQLIIGLIVARNKIEKKTDVEFNINESMDELINKSGLTTLISSIKNLAK